MENDFNISVTNLTAPGGRCPLGRLRREHGQDGCPDFRVEMESDAAVRGWPGVPADLTFLGDLRARRELHLVQVDSVRPLRPEVCAELLLRAFDVSVKSRQNHYNS